VLTSADGFPPLPPVQIGLMKRPGLSPSLVNAITDHITACLDNITLGPVPEDMDSRVKMLPGMQKLKANYIAPGW